MSVFRLVTNPPLQLALMRAANKPAGKKKSDEEEEWNDDEEAWEDDFDEDEWDDEGGDE